MKLCEVNWKAVHFKYRAILISDRLLFPRDKWEYLTNHVEVAPMKAKGHYRVLSVWEI